MKKAVYKILPEYNLIIEYYRGKINSEDIIELKKREVQDKLYNPNSNFIIDFRKLETPAGADFGSAVTRLNEYFQKLGLKGKVAILTSTPDHVVLSVLMKKVNKDSLNISTEPFSTLKTALRFVNCSPANDDIIKNILDELDESSFNKLNT